MKKTILTLILGTLLGFFIGRMMAPDYPAKWDKIAEGMHFSEVYEEIPQLEFSSRAIKGFDTNVAETGDSYWQLSVYYDAQGKVERIEKEFLPDSQ